MADSPLRKIEHIVVLMLENRSFDNLLGWLYDPGNPPPFDRVPPRNFDGLHDKDLWNPGPRGPVPVTKTDEMNAPDPSPDTDFEDVYSQLYNVIPIPSGSAVPPDVPHPAPMTGFVNNYAAVHPRKDPANVMKCFTPASVPVLSSLAHYYAVCDHWFSSVPSETFPNRSFLYAGTSSGHAQNSGQYLAAFTNHTTTIFELVEQAGRSWRIYTGSWTVTSHAFLTQGRLRRYIFTDRFANFEHFRKDASRPGGLPSLSIIEPIYFDSLSFGARNDMHPEWGTSRLLRRFKHSPLEWGEVLLHDVYTTVRNSPDWDKILLIITFDEHGGCYDHVPPPRAVPPDDKIIPSTQRSGTGFKFDRLGPRVPSIVISAYTPPGTIINTVLDHTTILSTAIECFELPTGLLGARQASMPGLGEALTLAQPRADQAPIPTPALSQMGVRRGMPRGWRGLYRALLPRPLSKLQRQISSGAEHAMCELGLAEEGRCAVECDRDAERRFAVFESILARKRCK